jgi:hypothetical protein
MKIRLFRAQAAQASTPAAKSAPTSRPVIVQAPPRMWSLLLPPGYTNDRR